MKTTGRVDMYGWHFLRSDRMLRYGDNRLVKEGLILTAKKMYSVINFYQPTLCDWGMHASPTIVQAAEFGAREDDWVCYVRVDRVTESDPDKFVGHTRTALQIYESRPVFEALKKSYCQPGMYSYYWLDIIQAMKTAHHMPLRDIEVAIRAEITKHNPNKHVPEVL